MPSPAPEKIAKGPSGFIEFNGTMLLVDYGKIYHNENKVGFLHEDGYLLGVSPAMGGGEGLTPIDKIPGCKFRGIDTKGLELVLPGDFNGPTGQLDYNGVPLNVVHGRVSDQDHLLLGNFDDTGLMYITHPDQNPRSRPLDENTQLPTRFKGVKSTGDPFNYEYQRPLYKKDRKYSENEIIRYFEGFDGLSTPQKKFVLESMKLWAGCGLLQIVRKSEGTAALGNVKHGAAGVTGVRTGFVTLDREEFEKEIVLSKKYGALAVVATRLRPYLEVRLNQVVSHEYGHQLEFVLSQAAQDRITEIYDQKLRICNERHPQPNDYDGGSELLTPQQVSSRLFISGYARSSMHEYWAECAAAFSVKESRDLLKQLDPDMYKLLEELVLTPGKMVRPVHVDTIIDLQLSLRIGGELNPDLLRS